jgi:hypothetical protein
MLRSWGPREFAGRKRSGLECRRDWLNLIARIEERDAELTSPRKENDKT